MQNGNTYTYAIARITLLLGILPSSSRAYDLQFNDCVKLKWEIYAPEHLV
jgi:hypothetical protein